MKLTHVHCNHFRSLRHTVVELMPLTVLIGANGSGKTTFLDSLHLLSESARGKLNEVVSAKGGFDALTNRKYPGGLGCGVRLTSDDDVLDYEITLNRQKSGIGYWIARELLAHAEGNHPFRGGTIIIDRDTRSQKAQIGDQAKGASVSIAPITDDLIVESVLAKLYLLDKTTKIVHEKLIDSAGLAPVLTDYRSFIRLPQELRPGMFPASDGQGLFSSLYNMRTLHSDRFDRVLSALRAGFPSFDRLEFPVVARGQVIISWYDKHSKIPFDQTQLSEGTLRFLWLVTILLSPEKPSLLMIDEPEVSMHPELLMILAGLFQQAATECQLIVATHSSNLLRWLPPESVLVFDKENDETTIKRLDKDELAEWLKEYTLEELWLKGELGGR